MSRTKLIDIAKLMNLSVSTVSRALRDSSEISQETKKKVLDIAKALKYHPNEFAVALRKQESKIVAVILNKLDHYFYSMILKGVVSMATQYKYQVLIAESLHDEKLEWEHIQNFKDRQVSGIILSPCRIDTHMEELKRLQQEIPLVLVDKYPDNYNGYVVTSNDYEGAYNATQHLIDCGYRKIVHLKGVTSSRIAEERCRGFKQCMEDNHSFFDEKWSIQQCYDVSFQEGYSCAKYQLASSEKPDAYFAIDDNVAIGVLHAAKELKINIPKDLGIVGYSDSLSSRYVSPQLTTVRQTSLEMGKKAFEMFLDIKNKESKNIKHYVFDSRLIKRETT